MTDLAVGSLLAVGGSVFSTGSWTFALRLGAVLVVAVPAAVCLVGRLAQLRDSVEIRHLEELYRLEAVDWDQRVDDR